MINKNFIKSHISISCETCKGCNILYDSHHDEHFSDGCGLVVMYNNILLVENGENNIKQIIFEE